MRLFSDIFETNIFYYFLLSTLTGAFTLIPNMIIGILLSNEYIMSLPLTIYLIFYTITYTIVGFLWGSLVIIIRTKIYRIEIK